MASAESSFADLRAAQRFALEIGALDDAFELIGSIREFAMRAMRYEVFAWAEAACRVPGALEHPLAPLLTGMRAYGFWVRGEFDLALSLAEESRRLERALMVAPTGLAERVLGNVLYIIDRSEPGNVAGMRQLELAEASGNESRLVHASIWPRWRSAPRGATTRRETSLLARTRSPSTPEPDRSRVGRRRRRLREPERRRRARRVRHAPTGSRAAPGTAG